MQIGTATNWQSVAAGYGHTVALKGDGTLLAWGGNLYGKLGDGTTAEKHSPVQIGTATNWQSVTAVSHTVALTGDGTLWAWGCNDYGQLGDGTMADKLSPVQIGTATNWQSVAADYYHTVALKRDGTLWAWGSNQLGDGQIVPEKIGLPVIASPPQDQTVQAGTRVSFTVTAFGSNPLSYQWRHGGTDLADSAQINGSQYASLTLFSPSVSDAGNYEVIVTNSYGSVTSAVATLRVHGTGASFGGMQYLRGAGTTCQLSGDPNHVIELYTSTNLIDWSLLTTLTNQTGTIPYTDTQSTNLPMRFYRAVQSS